jgi:TonB family protein
MSGFRASFFIHFLLILAVLALRATRETPQASDMAARTSAKLVFLPDAARPGGGDQGGGARQREPIQRAQARGTDAVSTPVAAPPSITPQPAPPDLVPDAPIVAAVPAFADLDMTRGLIAPELPRVGSQGPGSNGIGTGQRGGNGAGNDRGAGPGIGSGGGEGIYGLGNGVSAPVPVRQVRPQYTSAAMTARLAGSVIVECIVLPDGTVGDARVTRSLDARFGLDEEAIRAARQWRFRPGTLNGRPVAVRVTIELSFSIY